MPANILNLPCYKVLGIQENEHNYHIDVETLHAPTSCPHCQSSNLVGYRTQSSGGRRSRRIASGTPTRIRGFSKAVGRYCDSGNTSPRSKPRIPSHRRSPSQKQSAAHRLLARTRTAFCTIENSTTELGVNQILHRTRRQQGQVPCSAANHFLHLTLLFDTP